MSTPFTPKRRPGTMNRPGEAGMIHAAARAEVARALADVIAILAGMDLGDAVPAVFHTTRMPRRKGHVRH